MLPVCCAVHSRQLTLRIPSWLTARTSSISGNSKLLAVHTSPFHHLKGRTMSSSSISHPHSVKEINVPTPWGQLATKCWNLPSDDIRDLKSATTPPVVCLHGWQDNAGTWDKLIPLLDRDIPFICLDFCGHGKSSPRPVGSSNDFPLHVWDVKRVLDFLGLDSGVNLMGHSMGGAVSVCFAATFPDMMNKCLTFDAPAPFPRQD